MIKKVKNIRKFLDIKEGDLHYDKDKIQMECNHDNLLKIVDAQRKFGGVLCIPDRDLADKMIELGYEEKKVFTKDMEKDTEKFNKVNYFLGPGYYYQTDEITDFNL
ncbi:MAG: hypothetical protein SLAVMIC_00864 [uncultured marine phage]|uniref:Uncharacterized protein n=1 Tax=uncultured marine phage TaxID=707152 RepID=A0A8D9CCA6_9VIRU|nr:MAG: hypothetical protein SLAVMIC_00864 [uncultured marine phage]